MTIIAELTVDTVEEGLTISEYKYDAAGAFIRVSKCEGEHWRLQIDSDESGDSTVADQNEQARAVKAAAERVLYLNRPKRFSATGDAVSAEVAALIADRGWSQQYAADMFRMPQSRLSALMNGYSRWVLEDLFGVADAVDPDNAWEVVTRLAGVAEAAHRAEVAR
jgi:hypothetical protein